MSQQAFCPQCGAYRRVRPAPSGRAAVCAHCGQTFVPACVLPDLPDVERVLDRPGRTHGRPGSLWLAALVGFALVVWLLRRD